MSHVPYHPAEPPELYPSAGDVRALAVAGVVFGTLGLSCLPFNFGSWITFGWPIEPANTSMVDVWVFASTFIGLGLSFLLLISSLGCFHFRPWARYGMLLWAVASAAYGVLGIYFWGRFLLPWLRTEYVAMRGPDEVGGLIAWIIGSALSVFVLRVMSRPSTRAVFRSAHPHGAPII